MFRTGSDPLLLGQLHRYHLSLFYLLAAIRTYAIALAAFESRNHSVSPVLDWIFAAG